MPVHNTDIAGIFEEIADFLETTSPNIRTFHHPANMGLCEALKTGFEHCAGDYAVTLDIDLP